MGGAIDIGLISEYRTLPVSTGWFLLMEVRGRTVARNWSGTCLMTSTTSETCIPVTVVPWMSRISSPGEGQRKEGEREREMPLMEPPTRCIYKLKKNNKLPILKVCSLLNSGGNHVSSIQFSLRETLQFIFHLTPRVTCDSWGLSVKNVFIRKFPPFKRTVKPSLP